MPHEAALPPSTVVCQASGSCNARTNFRVLPAAGYFPECHLRLGWVWCSSIRSRTAASSATQADLAISRCAGQLSFGSWQGHCEKPPAGEQARSSSLFT